MIWTGGKCQGPNVQTPYQQTRRFTSQRKALFDQGTTTGGECFGEYVLGLTNHDAWPTDGLSIMSDHPSDAGLMASVR